MGIKLQKTLLALGVISVIIGNIISYGVNISYAEDLELIGNGIGLEVMPESRRLFSLANLSPGDTFEACLTIENRHISPFELFIRTQRVGTAPEEGHADAFKQLILTIYLEDKEIHSGSMMDFATSDISLGEFDLKDRQRLRAIVYLPGSETGNEFQGEGLEVKWIFTAKANDAKTPNPGKKDPGRPIFPNTGQARSLAFYGVGSALLGLGIGIGRRRRSN